MTTWKEKKKKNGKKFISTIFLEYHQKNSQKNRRKEKEEREKDYFLGFLDFLDRFGV